MTSGNVTTGTISRGFYRKRIWSGGDGLHSEEHPYSATVNNSFLIPVEYRPKGGVRWQPGSMDTFKPVFLKFPTNTLNNVVNKATIKVWDDLSQSKFNAGIFAGEFRESYHMTCDIVHSVAGALKAAKHGNFAKAWYILSRQSSKRYKKLSYLDRRAGLTGVAANNYMMWHFGIYPLLNDLEAAYNYMRTTYKVVKRVNRSASERAAAPLTKLGVTWQYEGTCIAEVRGDVEMLELSQWDRLGLNDLPTVAWELTKLSWMFDWLMPVGNFLSAVNASNKTKGQRFYLTRCQKEGVYGCANSGLYEIRPFDTSAYSMIVAPCDRSPMSSLPWAFPTIQNPLGDNLSRWVTSIAFLRQVAGR